MARQRVGYHEQAKTFALFLWEHGPINAIYINEMADKVAKIMSQRLVDAEPVTRATARALIRKMEKDGHLTVERDGEVLIKKIMYAGQDPTFDFAEQPKRGAWNEGLAKRLDELEARMTYWEGQIRDDIQTFIRREIKQTMDEWTR